MARRYTRGLTLVEMIATLCLTIVLAVVCLSFMIYATKFSYLRESRLTAVNAAYSTLEDLKEKARIKFSDAILNDSGINYKSYTLPNGNPIGYAITYKVTDANWPDPVTHVANPTNYKTINVICTYLFGSATVTMTGYVVNV